MFPLMIHMKQWEWQGVVKILHAFSVSLWYDLAWMPAIHDHATEFLMEFMVWAPAFGDKKQNMFRMKQVYRHVILYMQIKSFQ